MTSLSNIFVIYEASLMRFKAQNLEHHYVFLVLKYEKNYLVVIQEVMTTALK